MRKAQGLLERRVTLVLSHPGKDQLSATHSFDIAAISAYNKELYNLHNRQDFTHRPPTPATVISRSEDKSRIMFISRFRGVSLSIHALVVKFFK
jgi:hypothetical protein